MRFWLLVLMAFALLTPSTARAETIVMNSGAVSIWGKPLDPAALLDPYDARLNDKLSAIAMFSVWRLSAPLDRALFEADTQKTATEIFGVPVTDFAIDHAQLLDGSVAYGVMMGEDVIYLISAYQDDIYYVMLVMDINGVSEDAESVLDLAATALDPSTIPQTPSLMEGMITGFAGDFKGDFERPMSLLPGREDVPEGYQLIDKEFLSLRPD